MYKNKKTKTDKKIKLYGSRMIKKKNTDLFGESKTVKDITKLKKLDKKLQTKTKNDNKEN
ncbi:hypothetical protein [Orenia marismortui]|uniref:Uncharacterized protein n=1 Tax=Orenia marismortui TaxID=46469 RepID=A0A4R8GSD4_9FIRM|nr:hypothetical protein [Orenia marismortui]TDX48832.1 hypothetical protein C7959_12511 [Orenia marismortui]